MESSQPIYPKKCKLKLEQPRIMCSGREPVTCYYRGTIIAEIKDKYLPGYWIDFKYKGDLIRRFYDIKSNKFLEEELKDIILV